MADRNKLEDLEGLLFGAVCTLESLEHTSEMLGDSICGDLKTEGVARGLGVMAKEAKDRLNEALGIVSKLETTDG